MTVNEYLSQNKEVSRFFEGIDTEDIDKLKLLKYKRNTEIINSNKKIDGIYYITYGVCAVIREKDDGTKICSYKIPHYNMVGLLEVLSQNEFNFVDSLLALTNVIIIKFPIEAFYYINEKYPDKFLNIIKYGYVKLNNEIKMLTECRIYDSITNILSYLIMSYEIYKKIYSIYYNGEVKICENRQIMCDCIGIDVRTLHRVINDLKIKKLVNVRKGKIYITNDQYLALKQEKMIRTM